MKRVFAFFSSIAILLSLNLITAGATENNIGHPIRNTAISESFPEYRIFYKTNGIAYHPIITGIYDEFIATKETASCTYGTTTIEYSSKLRQLLKYDYNRLGVDVYREEYLGGGQIEPVLRMLPNYYQSGSFRDSDEVRYSLTPSTFTSLKDPGLTPGTFTFEGLPTPTLGTSSYVYRLESDNGESLYYNKSRGAYFTIGLFRHGSKEANTSCYNCNDSVMLPRYETSLYSYGARNPDIYSYQNIRGNNYFYYRDGELVSNDVIEPISQLTFDNCTFTGIPSWLSFGYTI